jgi:hypothetical protein
MEEIDFYKYLEKINNSQGNKKMKNYINEIFSSSSFQEFTKDIRKKYYIPKNGFKSSQENDCVPPRVWSTKVSPEQKKEFDEEIIKISKKYNIHFIDGINIFEDYLFFNNTEYAHINMHGLGMCLTDDIVLRKEEPYLQKMEEEDDFQYPIAIRISPYASLRDILDFVKRAYKHDISRLQKKYKKDKVRIGKIRKKNSFIEERNNFIYENKDLPRKKIMSLLYRKYKNKEGFDIDEANISKIISLRKRNNRVSE